MADTSPVISNATPVSVRSGSTTTLLPNVTVSDPTGGSVSVTLSIPADEGKLSIDKVPQSVAPTLIGGGTYVTMFGTAAEVTAALRAVQVTGASGASGNVSGQYRVTALNVSRLSSASGTLTVQGSVGYTQLDATTYAVGGDPSVTAVISTGLAKSTIYGGDARLDYTGGNGLLVLNGKNTGAVTVHSLGNNEVWVGASSALHYVSGGNSLFYTGPATVDISGGAASDVNTVALGFGSGGATSITQTGPSQMQIFGGSGMLRYDGGNAVVVLNGRASSDAVITSTGNNVVWGGSGTLSYVTGGASQLVLGSGAATVAGGAAGGSNGIVRGTGALSYAGVSEAETISGGSGSARAVITAGNSSLTFSGGNATITLGSRFATLTGGEAGTTNSVTGGSGGFSYRGQAEAATVTGGSGSDTIFAGSGGGSYTAGSGGHSLLTATGGVTVLQGTASGDTLVGAASGSTVMRAGAGNETLVGGAGNASFVLGGGAGTVSLGGGSSTVVTGPGSSTITGGAGSAVVSIGAHDGAVAFLAGQGDATLRGFRLGTDHLLAPNQSVAATRLAGGGTVITLSGGATITLSGVDATHTTHLLG